MKRVVSEMRVLLRLAQACHSQSLQNEPEPTFSNLRYGCHAFKPQVLSTNMRQDRKAEEIKVNGKEAPHPRV